MGLIVAQVISQTATHPQAKAGLMIRESLTPGARTVTFWQRQHKPAQF